VLDDDWNTQVERYCVGWVCGRDAGVLVGFVNVAWDGASSWIGVTRIGVRWHR
jgi:hypothetical protein